MKVRRGFVSNSSSSSFLVLGEEETIPKGINYKKLTPFQISRAKRYKQECWDYKHYDKEMGEKYGDKTLEEIKKMIQIKTSDCWEWKQWLENRLIDSIQENDDVFLTEFISDCCDDYDISSKLEVIDFMSGGHGIPYDPEELEVIKKGSSEYDTVYFLEPLPKSVDYVQKRAWGSSSKKKTGK